MKNPSLHLLLAASMAAALAPAAHAQILSNGTGGGDFATGSTWTGGVVPAGAFTVQAGDTVTGGNGLTYSSSNNSYVFGTLTLGSGSSITMGRLNNGSSSNPIHVENTTVNVTGGTLSVSRITPSTSSGTNTINVSAGTFIFRDSVTTGAHYTFNVSGSGVIRTAGGINAPLNISGGTVIFEGTAQKSSGAINWNGGTVILSSGAAHNSNNSNSIFDGWKLNDANVLAFSSQATKQTVTIGTSTSNPTITSDQGVMSFNVYSSTANDNDVLSFAFTSGVSLGSGVDIRLEGVALTGSASDYLGQSFQLFSIASGNYSNLNPTISSTFWTIGGEEYEVGWTNNLAVDGSLTISTLTSTAIPEPSTFAALGGLAALAVASSRRARR